MSCEQSRKITKEPIPDIVFVNGKSECGCKIEFSDGYGEYSDVHEIILCNKHRLGGNCSGYQVINSKCIHGHKVNNYCKKPTDDLPECAKI